MDRSSSVQETILPRVSRPNRYLGSALNQIRGDAASAKLSVVLALGDAYEIGMSHLGLRLLYHILSRRADTVAEFCFAPWPDAERELRRSRVPLVSLGSQRPLSEFDLIGFSLQYELHYTNILNMLELGGVPLLSRERGEQDPLVIGGGHSAYNPEPVADFFDAFVVGDGEEVVLRVAEETERWREGNCERPELLRRLAGIAGVYVPEGYDLETNQAGFQVPRARPGWPEHVQSVWVKTLKPEYYPEKPLVPLSEITHDRLTVEVMRGCTRGCRFCQAGMINRPVRQKPPEQIVSETVRGIESTGWDEVSLMSLSTTDHTEIVETVDKLTRQLCGNPVGLSLPSTRPGTLPPKLAETLNDSRSGHLTLAPEAGTQRMRDIINKGVCEEELLESVSIAARQGYTGAKLYFMIGLPGERPEDLVGIIELGKKALATGRAAAEKRRFGVTVSISPHVPKPQTPFQWEAQDPPALVEEKIRLLRSRVKGTGLVLKWRDSETTFLEGVFSRGDRRLGEAIVEAMRRGCRFDGWTEHLRYDEWLQVFEDLGIDPARYLAAREPDVRQCWEHVRSPVSRRFLLREREKARRAEVSVDCRLAFCHACGIDHCPDRISPTGRPPGETSVSTISAPAPPPNGDHRRELLNSSGASLALATRFRLRFIKEAAVRFISHLELMRIWERALRRSRLPLAYTEGFRPHLKMSFGPPLPVGYISRAEYFDLEFARPPGVELLETLNPLLPEGIRLTSWRPILFKTPSLMSAINQAAYHVEITDSFLAASGLDAASLDSRLTGAVTRLLNQKEILVRRNSKGGTKEIDLRPSIEEIEVSPSKKSLLFRIRFTPRAQARPEEILTRILPEADARLARVERTGLWVVAEDERLDPFETLNAVAAPNREGNRAQD